jgi:hypothetical protein
VDGDHQRSSHIPCSIVVSHASSYDIPRHDAFGPVLLFEYWVLSTIVLVAKW